MSFKERLLGDLLTFQRGFDITKADQSSGVVPIVSSSGISSFHNEAKVQGPGVVIGRKGTLGTVHYIDRDYWPHDTTLWVKDFKGSHPRFIAYFLSTLKLENFDTGASNPTLNRNHLHKIKVLAPDPAEQKKIAAILAALDDLLAINQRRITLLESMAEEIYREWFVRMRFPGHTDCPFEKGLPKGWTILPLSSLVSDVKKPVRKSDLLNHSRYVGLEHISRKSVALTMFGIPESADSDKLAFASGDILFSKIRPYLHKVALAHFDGVSSTDSLVLRAKNELYTEFSLFTVFSETFIDLANTASKGTKMPRADWHFLKQLRVSTPNDALLDGFVKIVRPMLDEIAALIQVNEILTEQARSLLPRLISGKLSVDHLDIKHPLSMQTDQA